MVGCNSISIIIIILGSIGNLLCLAVFSRKAFRASILTPFFVGLLMADCLYLVFRVMKLSYLQETLFDRLLPQLHCSSSLLAEFYGYLSQNAPQFFVPLFHYEFYIRFSLLLMSFLTVQRAYDMYRTHDRLLTRKSSKYLCAALIITAFIISYALELTGLNIFCSTKLDSRTAYEWYQFLRINMSNETVNLFKFMKNQSASENELNCIIGNSTNCSENERKSIIRK